MRESPTAVQLFTVEPALQVAVAVTGMRIGEWPPCAAVPDHDGSAAVLAFRDDAFEVGVFDGVVFDVNGKATLAGIEARTSWNGPAFQDAVEFNAEIVMEPRGVVLLDDENAATGFLAGLCGRPAGRAARGAGGFGGDREVAFFAVGLERHGGVSWKGRSVKKDGYGRNC